MYTEVGAYPGLFKIAELTPLKAFVFLACCVFMPFIPKDSLKFARIL